MLVRLIYASRARQAIDTALLDAILATSLERNPRHGITGVLCHGNGVFLQALEGDRQEVSQLFQSIARDPRHQDVTLLHFEETCTRDFAGWAMLGQDRVMDFRPPFGWYDRPENRRGLPREGGR